MLSVHSVTLAVSPLLSPPLSTTNASTSHCLLTFDSHPSVQDMYVRAHCLFSRRTLLVTSFVAPNHFWIDFHFSLHNICPQLIHSFGEFTHRIVVTVGSAAQFRLSFPESESVDKDLLTFALLLTICYEPLAHAQN